MSKMSDSETGELQRGAVRNELEQAIMGGIVFKGARLSAASKAEKVKTKAKKKAYVAGTHGSGAARKKAEIRARRANRHKGK